MSFKIEDLVELGYKIHEISEMFDNKVGIDLRAALDNVPTKKALDEILGEYDKSEKTVNSDTKVIPDDSVEVETEPEDEFFSFKSNLPTTSNWSNTNWWQELIGAVEANIKYIKTPDGSTYEVINSDSVKTIPSGEISTWVVNEEEPKEDLIEYSEDDIHDFGEETEPEPIPQKVPVQEKPVAKPKPVFIQMDGLQEMEMFKKFKKHASKTYQVVLPNSGGIATVKPIPLPALDSLNSSSLFSDFEYYKALLSILFESIVETTLPNNSFEEFISNINIYDIDEILFGVYKLMYGDNTDFSTNCNDCGSSIELKIKLEDIKVASIETKVAISNILNGDYTVPDFSTLIEVPELEGTLVQISLPTLKKQIDVNTFLEQHNETLDGKLYKFLLHVDFVAVPVGDNNFHQYTSLTDIYKCVTATYTDLGEVSLGIDSYAKYYSGFKGSVKCPSCGVSNPLSYDIKTDFLIKALNN